MQSVVFMVALRVCLNGCFVGGTAVYAGLACRFAIAGHTFGRSDALVGAVFFIKAMPDFDSIRADPRYADLLRKMELSVAPPHAEVPNDC